LFDAYFRLRASVPKVRFFYLKVKDKVTPDAIRYSLSDWHGKLSRYCV